MRALGIVLFAAVAACSNNPPPIGTSDASKDSPTSDVAPPNEGGGPDGAPTDGGSPDSTGTCTLTSPPSNPTCASCVQTACCQDWNTCAANSDCVAYVACVRACFAVDAGPDGGPPPPPPPDAGFGDGGDNGGFACAKQCETQYPNGVSDGISVADCENNACAFSCP